LGLKSRYCVKCDAVWKYQCRCPNHRRMANIKKFYQKISKERPKQAMIATGTQKGVCCNE